MPGATAVERRPSGFAKTLRDATRQQVGPGLVVFSAPDRGGVERRTAPGCARTPGTPCRHAGKVARVRPINGYYQTCPRYAAEPLSRSFVARGLDRARMVREGAWGASEFACSALPSRSMRRSSVGFQVGPQVDRPGLEVGSQGVRSCRSGARYRWPTGRPQRYR